MNSCASIREDSWTMKTRVLYSKKWKINKTLQNVYRGFGTNRLHLIKVLAINFSFKYIIRLMRFFFVHFNFDKVAYILHIGTASK